MYKKCIWIVAMAFSLFLNQSAFADSMRCGEGLKKMVENLKLDDTQKGKIKPIMEQLKANIKASASKMQDLDGQIHQQVTSDTMDESTVNGLVDQKTKLIGEMIKAKITAKNQIFAVLTPQQKTQFQNSMKKMHDKMVAKFKSCQDED